ncbi:acyl-CoA reductase-like NAD-dependent aldehyde dehydrogenase [Bradyrhizobium sp. USDA 4516]
MTDLQRFYNVVDGKQVASESGRWLPSKNPFTGRAWAEVPQCSAEDVDAAVQTAHRAFVSGPWANLNATGRGRLMRRLGDLIARDAERLAAIEVRDNGKLLAEIGGQLRYIPEWFYYYGGLADKIEGGIPTDKRSTTPSVSLLV